MGKIRLRRNKHRCMIRRLTGVKKPMSAEQKETQKKQKEVQREASKAFLAKKK